MPVLRAVSSSSDTRSPRATRKRAIESSSSRMPPELNLPTSAACRKRVDIRGITPQRPCFTSGERGLNGSFRGPRRTHNPSAVGSIPHGLPIAIGRPSLIPRSWVNCIACVPCRSSGIRWHPGGPCGGVGGRPFRRDRWLEGAHHGGLSPQGQALRQLPLRDAELRRRSTSARRPPASSSAPSFARDAACRLAPFKSRATSSAMPKCARTVGTKAS